MRENFALFDFELGQDARVKRVKLDALDDPHGRVGSAPLTREELGSSTVARGDASNDRGRSCRSDTNGCLTAKPDLYAAESTSLREIPHFASSPSEP